MKACVCMQCRGKDRLGSISRTHSSYNTSFLYASLFLDLQKVTFTSTILGDIECGTMGQIVGMVQKEVTLLQSLSYKHIPTH